MMNEIYSPTCSDNLTERNGDFSSLPLGLRDDSRFAGDAEFLRKLSKLSSEQLPKVVARGLRTMGWNPLSAEKRRIEFLRFVSLIYLTDLPQEPNRFADDFWHLFLLFTHDYHDFCKRHFGKFLHHVPLDSDTVSIANSSSAIYEECFGNKWETPLNVLEERLNKIRPLVIEFMAERDQRWHDGNSTSSMFPRREHQDFTKWGDWNNSWKNWGNWKEWNNWKLKGCVSCKSG